MKSLAAIVLGVMPVSGGVSSIAGTAIGPLVLITVLQLTGWGVGRQNIFEGHIVIRVVTVTSRVR